MEKVVRPKLNAKWRDLINHYIPDHAVGVATGQGRSLLLVESRSGSDLVSIGAVPNIAKLSDIRSGSKITFITSDVYNDLDDKHRLGGDPKRNMWSAYLSGQTYLRRIHGELR